MVKIDLKKSPELKQLYQASAKAIVELDVPALNYLMVDGQGDPNTSPGYAQAVEALFTVSYTAKFMLKKGPQAIDYAVMPLEGLWWADDMAAFSTNDRARWKWTMMIMQPEFVTNDVLAEAMEQVRQKKALPAIDRLRVARFTEGVCAQLLHIGPFTEEGPSIERLHAYIDERSGRSGKHHEIYLSDIRRADPKNWKTIIRQPMLQSGPKRPV
ncbi:GyrI-like domain-containing protein [Paucibacter sp. KCTC 42545]|uniref:GyrI-like domain-containing protein n=1 Tax=Paucibacter sp. KCTC 42545 TaxID=1768242 RepID=UPI000733B57B|nr:GyrI-like domain-containing protein [Paucibacter sp. KCTC 42545]ALT78947.1 hypothetical protein AT984_18895 [Paucibacter sp. KCTC 42545]